MLQPSAHPTLHAQYRRRRVRHSWYLLHLICPLVHCRHQRDHELPRHRMFYGEEERPGRSLEARRVRRQNHGRQEAMSMVATCFSVRLPHPFVGSLEHYLAAIPFKTSSHALYDSSCLHTLGTGVLSCLFAQTKSTARLTIQDSPS